jgi:hypothetical protein
MYGLATIQEQPRSWALQRYLLARGSMCSSRSSEKRESQHWFSVPSLFDCACVTVAGCDKVPEARVIVIATIATGARKGRCCMHRKR